MSYNEKRERDALEDVQANRPGSGQRVSELNEREQEMKRMDEEFGFPPPKADPQRDPKTVMRREIYSDIARNQNSTG